eukprot:1187143-Amphidinium_carterae.1
MAKVHGPENPADLMTKFLNADMMYKHLKKLGLRVRKEWTVLCRLDQLTLATKVHNDLGDFRNNSSTTP